MGILTGDFTNFDFDVTKIYTMLEYMSKAIANSAEVVRRADAGEFNGKDGEDGAPGPQGPQGPQGLPGAGFGDLVRLNLTLSTPDVTYDSDEGATVESVVRFATALDNFDFPVSYKLPIKGSEEIVVDANEDGDAIELHLDNSVSSKIARSLVTPLSTPSEPELVGVGDSNEQIRVQLGDGLSLEGSTSPYTLKTSGGGSLYNHSVKIQIQGVAYPTWIYFNVISSSSEALDSYSKVATYLHGRGSVVGMRVFPDTTKPNFMVTRLTEGAGALSYYTPSTSQTSPEQQISIMAFQDITDTVTAI